MPDHPQEVLCLPSPDWLPHELTVVGPSDDLATFRQAASGPGVIPWQLNYDRLQEDWLHRLLAPPPARRGISLEGARILAGQMRAAIEMVETQQNQLQIARLCPLDLHALRPVPGELLRLSPRDPAVIGWLWENWGTTWALRHVEESSTKRLDVPVPAGLEAISWNFWSADWTPWRALSAIRLRWPSLAFHVKCLGITS